MSVETKVSIVKLIQHYRNLVRSFLQDYGQYKGRAISIGSDEDLLQYLEHLRSMLLEELISTTDAHLKESCKCGLYVLGAGLLTYGRLDGIYDLLDYVPPYPRGAKIHNYIGILKSLLPIPESLQNRVENIISCRRRVLKGEAVRQTKIQTATERQIVRSWIEDNLERLHWNETTMNFELTMPL